MAETKKAGKLSLRTDSSALVERAAKGKVTIDIVEEDVIKLMAEIANNTGDEEAKKAKRNFLVDSIQLSRYNPKRMRYLLRAVAANPFLSKEHFVDSVIVLGVVGLSGLLLLLWVSSKIIGEDRPVRPGSYFAPTNIYR